MKKLTQKEIEEREACGCPKCLEQIRRDKEGEFKFSQSFYKVSQEEQEIIEEAEKLSQTASKIASNWWDRNLSRLGLPGGHDYRYDPILGGIMVGPPLKDEIDDNLGILIGDLLKDILEEEEKREGGKGFGKFH